MAVLVFYWRKGKDQSFMDLSLFHHPRDLRLNGILDVDCVMIRVTSSETLAQVVKEEFLHKSYEELVKIGRVVDRFHGFRAWLSSKPNVVKWLNVERDPAQVSVRVIRGYGKAGVSILPKRVISKLTTLCRQQKDNDAFQTIRGLLKILKDNNGLAELRTHHQIGAIAVLSPWLDEKISNMPTEELKDLFDRAPKKGSARAHFLFISLFKRLPKIESAHLIPIVERIDEDLAQAMKKKLKNIATF